MRHSALAATLLLFAACSGPAKPAPTPTPAPGTPADEQGLRVTGPYLQDNLAVYLVHSSRPDDRDFVTLDEGLKSGAVTVTEKSRQEVNELELENKGDRPLFIQEGDRVIGGQQDRIIGMSFVVPARSGRMGVPSFCVEQGRWNGATMSFGAGYNAALADKQCRIAAKVSADQGRVWESVASAKGAAGRGLAGATGEFALTTSLNEMLEDPKVRELCDKKAAAFAAILAQHPDAVGAAIAVNGKIEEIDLYPGPALLRKIFPRLVRSYAVQAAVDKKEAAAPAAGEIAAMMKQEPTGQGKKEAVGRNDLSIDEILKGYRCITAYEGKRIHQQWLVK